MTSGERAAVWAAIGASAVALVARVTVPRAYLPLFQETGKAFGVDPALLRALAWRESNFDPNAVGVKNRNGTRDYGLMQINESNFAALGLTSSDWNDPGANLAAAAKLLVSIEKSNKSVSDTVAVYNAGPSSVAGRVGGPKLTASGDYVNQAYVFDVWVRYFMVKLSGIL